MAEYRRFIASSLAEAKREMIKEMGINSYIVKTQKITKKSMFGFRKTNLVEIQAGRMGEKAKELSKKEIGKVARRHVPETYIKDGDTERDSYTNALVVEDKSTNHSFLAESLAAEAPKKESIERVKELISQKYQPSNLERKPVVPEMSSPSVNINVDHARQAIHTQSVSQTEKSRVKAFLENMEFQDDFIQWVDSRYQGTPPEHEEGKESLALFVASQFRYSGAVKVYASNPNIVLLVGPTGIGKTTTLAKIASHYAVGEGKSCVLATFDVRRIMATAQLEKFALIMETPFRILRQKPDLKKLISEYIEKNLIFIDTAGTSHHDSSYLEEMADFISYISIPKEIHLGLNASLRAKEMEKIVDHFKDTCFDRVILTKCDESGSLGPILSVLHRYNLPISYMTIGQDVPTHFQLASEDTIAKRLLMEWA